MAVEKKISAFHKDPHKTLEVLHKLSLITSKEKDYGKILTDIAALLGKELNLKRCSFLAIESDRLAYVIAAYEDNVTKNLRIYLEKYPDIQRMMYLKETTEIKSVLNDPLLKKQKKDFTDNINYSAMAVPVIYGDKLIGLIFLKADRNGLGFSEAEIELCQMAATISYKALKVLSADVVITQGAKDKKRSVLNDKVTGLYNQSYFTSRLEQMFNESMRYDFPFSLLLITIDDYKKIHENEGDEVTKRILQDVAQHLTASARQTDIFFKTGDDEFAIMMPHTKTSGVLEKATRIKDLIEMHAFGGVKKPITATIGIANYPMRGIFKHRDLYDITQKEIYLSKKSAPNQLLIIKAPK